MTSALGSGAELFQRSLWWMVPGWLIGRIRPSLARATDADAIALGHRKPIVVGLVLPLAAIVVALVPSIIHATTKTALSIAQVDYLRIRIDDVYTESLLFMAAAILIGILSPSLGAFFVLAFGVFDLWAASMQPLELVRPPDAIVGRLISYWLLWLLVVEIPCFGRTLVETAGGGAVERIRSALIGGLATGGFAFLWTLAAPTLIRPVYSLSFMRVPQIAAIFPLQNGGWFVAVAAGLGAAVFIAVRGSEGLLGREPVRPPLLSRREAAIGLHVLRAALLTVGLAGLILRPTDALILFGALLLARPVAWLIVTRAGLGIVTSRIPRIVRIGLAVAAAFAVALVTVPRFYTANDRDFFAVIVGLVGAFFVIEILLVDRSEVTPEPESDTPPSALAGVVTGLYIGLLAGLVLILISFVLPLTVLADNCADPGDCYGLGAGAGAAAGGAGAALNSRKKGPPRDDPKFIKDKLDYIDKQIKKNPDNQYWQSQKKYWSGDTSPKSDGKSTSGAAFGSSGAATKA